MNSTETYTRVIPRDFFNEAKLLKCMGQLSLKILDGMLPTGVDILIEESGEPFEINRTIDGNIFVVNYYVTVNQMPVQFATKLNSKEPYPLMAIVDYEEYEVFDNNGNFTTDFINRFSNY
jgi:hypothetical protein